VTLRISFQELNWKEIGSLSGLSCFIDAGKLEALSVKDPPCYATGDIGHLDGFAWECTVVLDWKRRNISGDFSNQLDTYCIPIQLYFM